YKIARHTPFKFLPNPAIKLPSDINTYRYKDLSIPSGVIILFILTGIKRRLVHTRNVFIL
ncbi:MAG: hypothetical protein J7L82_06430, partial [Staphylothermus sp.]|nr:hypothetical protein [Staphylothermus sp.]